MTTTCAQCGIEFVPSRKDARFCSGRCRTAAYRAGRRSVTPDVTAPVWTLFRSAGVDTSRVGEVPFIEGREFWYESDQGHRLVLGPGQVLLAKDPDGKTIRHHFSTGIHPQQAAKSMFAAAAALQDAGYPAPDRPNARGRVTRHKI